MSSDQENDYSIGKTAAEEREQMTDDERNDFIREQVERADELVQDREKQTDKDCEKDGDHRGTDGDIEKLATIVRARMSQEKEEDYECGHWDEE